jgi:tetratricopeptide (TPR) repeat protein
VGAAVNRVSPFQPWGAFFLSVAAEARGELPRAKWMIDLALKKNSSYGILHYQKARLLWLDKQYAEALQLAKKAVDMDPGLTDGHKFLAQVYFRDQEFDLASEQFYSVLRARPSDAEALSGLADSRFYRGDYNGAMEVLNRGLGYHPEIVEFQWRLAQIYENNLNDKVRALNAYIQLKHRLARYPSKTLSAVDVDNKIRDLEKAQRQPAVSAQADESAGKGKNP